MLQMESEVNVADNTGAKRARVIRKRGQNTRTAGIGDIVVVHVVDSTPSATVAKGKVSLAVIVRTRYPIRREDGSYLRWDDNAVVLLNNSMEPVGTRVFGSVARELRKNKNFAKIISLAPEVL